MLPTSYRGAATIDGEELAAELHLDAEHIALRLENEREVLRWPITQTDVTAVRNGDYRLRMGEETFEFTPVVDDGLGDEIALRRRFAQNGSTAPAGEDIGPAHQAPPAATIADRVAEAGRTSARRPGVLEGKDLGLRTALVVLGVLALAVASVAVWSGALQNRPTTVVVGAEATAPTTVAAPETTVPPTTVPVPTTAPAAPATTLPPASTTTLTPPTVAPATVTTSATVPPPSSVFEATPDQLVTEWDSVARPLDPVLTAGDLTTGESTFAFSAGDYVDVEGSLADGRVSSIRLLGDPTGPDFEDRRVLTALGITVAVVEPDLPPSGRRQLLESLGLDIADPDVEGLDASLPYAGKDWTLRWDGEFVIFEVAPEGTLSTEDEDS